MKRVDAPQGNRVEFARVPRAVVVVSTELGKEHRLHGTVPGDRVTVIVRGGFGDELLSARHVWCS